MTDEEKEQTVAVLVKAKALISGPRSWTQGALARNASFDCTDTASPWACSFCALGAVIRVGEDMGCLGDSDNAIGALGRVSDKLTWGTIASLNDDITTRHEDILALFDLAIEEASK